MERFWVHPMLWICVISCPQLSIQSADTEHIEPGQPAALELYQDTVTSFVALWTPPLEGDPVVRGYKLGLGIYEPDEKILILGPSKRYHRITAIRHNFVYVVSLRAFNNVGDGPPYYETIYTETFVKTTPAPAEPLLSPVNVSATTRSARTILVTWTDLNWVDRPPPQDRFYAIRYNPGEEIQDYTYINTTQPSLLVGGLNPNTEFYFRVMVGQGHSLRVSDWSPPASNITLGAAPGSMPRSVAVYEIGLGVNIRWATPEVPNSPLSELEYSVMYTSEALQGEWVTVEAGSRLGVSIPSLASGKYFFIVAVKNKFGTGPTSPMKVVDLGG